MYLAIYRMSSMLVHVDLTDLATAVMGKTQELDASVSVGVTT
jgi:hypothetical protein